MSLLSRMTPEQAATLRTAIILPAEAPKKAPRTGKQDLERVMQLLGLDVSVSAAVLIS